jgi:ELWxxDGT repeat protein
MSLVASGLSTTPATATDGWTVIDINEGANSSTPMFIKNFGGYNYFTADDGVNGRELWVSDGTEAGTSMVIDACVGSGSGYSDSRWDPAYKQVEDTLYFVASPNCNTSDWGLYRTEIGSTTGEWIVGGTSATDSLYNWSAMSSTSADGYIDTYSVKAVVGNYLVFGKSDVTGSGMQAYAFDMTTDVVTPGDGVTKLVESAGWSSNFTAFNNKVYWMRAGILFSWDGTNVNSPLVIDNDNFDANELHSMGTEMLYLRGTGGSDAVLAVLDTNLVSRDIQGSHPNFNIDGSVRFHKIGDVYYFTTVTNGTVYSPSNFYQALWSYTPGDSYATKVAISGLGHDSMFQYGSVAEFGGKLIASDWYYGLVDVQEEAANTTTFGDSYITGPFAVVGDYIYGQGQDGNYDYEFYKVGTDGNVSMIANLNSGASSTPQWFSVVDGLVQFAADSETQGRELFVYDPAFVPEEPSDPETSSVSVLFGPDSAKLTKAAKTNLQEAIASLPENSEVTQIKITASFKKVFWSDKVGEKLAKKRAKAVKAYLKTLLPNATFQVNWKSKPSSAKNSARNAKIVFTYQPTIG